MAKILKDMSHTFDEYLIIPQYSSSDCLIENVTLKTPISKFKKGEKPKLELNIPLVSAIMQAVSNDELAIALAKEGGLSFIYGNQTIESEAAMVNRVKKNKAGFVVSNCNICPDKTLSDLLVEKAKLGHSTFAVTDDGTAYGKLLGLVTSKDYLVGKTDPKTKIKDLMTPVEKLIVGKQNTTLKEANNIIWEEKLNQLPIIDKNGKLMYLVFRKDYEAHKENQNELLDDSKRYVCGAGINTRDYELRVPALVEAGADILCIDSSEGFNEFQEQTLKFIKTKYKGKVLCGAGNVVSKEGFDYLVKCGADFVKVGIGGGSICITRETKGIGRGQASALLEVAQARDEYFKKTGIYIPICSDGGIVHDHHITLALAMGADFIMLGRYFARFDESPSNKILLNGRYYKEYWGEGSARARNWQRYDLGKKQNLSFVEGVDAYVPYAGKLKENVAITLTKIKSTLCNCGAKNIQEFQKKAVLCLVSETSIKEGGAHDVTVKDNLKEN